jgi:hypothetical protein
VKGEGEGGRERKREQEKKWEVGGLYTPGGLWDE